jgi:RNase P subunit RPR2
VLHKAVVQPAVRQTWCAHCSRFAPLQPQPASRTRVMDGGATRLTARCMCTALLLRYIREYTRPSSLLSVRCLYGPVDPRRYAGYAVHAPAGR